MKLANQIKCRQCGGVTAKQTAKANNGVCRICALENRYAQSRTEGGGHA